MSKGWLEGEAGAVLGQARLVAGEHLMGTQPLSDDPGGDVDSANEMFGIALESEPDATSNISAI